MADLYPDEDDTDRKGMPQEHLDKVNLLWMFQAIIILFKK